MRQLATRDQIIWNKQLFLLKIHKYLKLSVFQVIISKVIFINIFPSMWHEQRVVLTGRVTQRINQTCAHDIQLIENYKQ